MRGCPTGRHLAFPTNERESHATDNGLFWSLQEGLSVRRRVQTALFRHVVAQRRREATARQNAGHYRKWLNWANTFEQPPARMRGGLR